MTDHIARDLRELSIDHVVLYVKDLDAAARDFARNYGLLPYATAERPDEVRSVAIGRGRIRLILVQALSEDHPAADYTRQHGDGVIDIALRTLDAAAAFTEAVRRGARPLAEPAEDDGVIMATIAGFGDVQHTFVQRRAGSADRHLPGLAPVHDQESELDSGLLEIDHFAVCVEAGSLRPTVDFYEQVLGFRNTFTERIIVGAQAMDSEVVQSPSGAVTFTLIEPDTSREPGQIDHFIKNHGGSGVQHIAFRTEDIVSSVSAMRDRGLEFLTAPPTYYRMLGDRLRLVRHSTEHLAALNILADEDYEGQLFQIFTRSVHPRKTLFFEVIERAGATTFGSGNIKALYEAVEAEHLR
ncbi:4-hydroxyphenylpyruvate dioxygenase [Streptomyces californicus]|uniref:4-hydroxyphenylpyruvate dioxygenase n=1 Tax=Streptomyces californicus TaxID=67351 RepID=UPI00296F3019|nr:4-hydroxyphenylpyruvate dioxygenase [Streptomyces californicus]MDW4901631.1 4-hydroxyphenylpyruvate dioxygenase [Streptomyces californicus]